MSIYVYSYVM